MRKINIYACGGTGTNIAASLASYHGQSLDGLAELNFCFIDTSKSNLVKNIPDDLVYLYTKPDGSGLDGNGKVRSSNYNVLAEEAKIQQILHQFKPADLNIVLHSGGGGTGSVAGPLLVKELINRKQAVVVIMVGSTTSRRDIKNTLDTLKTYENFANNLSRPINVLYRENTLERTREDVNAEIERYIFMLAVIFSGQNHGLDSSDLRNFLDYSAVSGLPPRLTAIDLFAGKIQLPPSTACIGAVSLTENNDEVHVGVMVEFHVSGQIHPSAFERMKANMPLHAAVFSGFFPPVVSRLQGLIASHEEQTRTVSGRTILSSEDKPNSDGMVM